MTFHTNNPVSNTQELHLLTSKEYIYNMYIIYIPELDISSPLEESINIKSGIKHLTHSPKRVSQILIALDFAL
jgi:hypothetical protein